MKARSQLSEQASTSPEDQWEEWMDWNPKPKSLADQQPTPPSESIALGNSQRSSRDGNRALNSPPVPKASGARVQPSKKRKVSADNANSSASPDGQKSSSVLNRSHSLVEKRYRNNLNDKITDLRKSIPSLREDAQNRDEQPGSVSAPKFNKATILTKAIEYIHQLEKRNAYLEDANDALRRHARNAAKETGQEEILSKQKASEGPENVDESSSLKTEPSSPSSEAPRGTIPVPEDIRRLRDVGPQAHYADDVRFGSRAENVSSGDISIRGGRVLGKLVLGSLAGLMIMDRIAGSPEEDRGLFALPLLNSIPITPLLRTAQRHLASFRYNFLLLPFVKGLLVFCALGFLLFLYLFNSKPKLGKPTSKTNNVGASQSSDSPMGIRRNAWLTSIQTVWIPRHSMLPEMWGLINETHAYMTRQLLGWQSYSWLTGRSEEEETARVRAWEIALDAQLTGGDTELSKGRLVLTLWAAGTLPKTPGRIMLKALHLRVMFWQASNSAWVCRTLNLVATQLARYQWKLAQKMLHAAEGTSDSDYGELPDYLASLLKRPIEDVMTSINVHRLHNLAWNRPTNFTTEGEIEIDSLVEDDTAMRGPLDILALWSSNTTLQQALRAFIESGKTNHTCLSQIKLALRTAPPGSSSFVRALAATAVLSDTDLGSNITALLQALPLVKPGSLPTSLADFESLSKTIRKDIMIAIECTEGLVMVMGVQQEAESITKALQVLERSLSNSGSMGLLGFAAALRLLLVISKDDNLARQSRCRIMQILRNTIILIEEPSEQKEPCPGRLRDYSGALQRLLPIQHPKRRSSGVSIDTGYGSMSEEEDIT